MKGIGTDIIELSKIKSYSGKKYFLEKIFTKNELEYSKGNIAHLATTFAAKEAVFKALGKGWLDPMEIEIRRGRSGKPGAVFLGKLKKKLGNRKIMLSLSYTKNYAVAFAIVK